MKSRSLSGLLTETVTVCMGAALLLYAGARFDFLPSGLKAWLAPAGLLYLPLIALLLTDRDFGAAGLESPDWRRIGLDLLAYGLVILPAFLAGAWLFFRFGLGKSFAVRPVAGLFSLSVWQAFGIALPEELFFRGWLQGRLNQVLAPRWNLLGAQSGPGLPLTALVFALAHLIVRPHPVRLLVFFPGLLFGWLRERTGSIIAPAAAHAAGNITFIVLQTWFH